MTIVFGDDEDQYFDSRENVSSSLSLDCAVELDVGWSSFECDLGNFHSDLWMGTPKSICERRDRFLRWMNFGSDFCEDGGNRMESQRVSDEIAIDADLVATTSGADLMYSDFDDEFFSSRSSISIRSNNAAVSSTSGRLEESFLFGIRDLDSGTEFIAGELVPDGMLKTTREVGSNKSFAVEEYEREVGLTPFVQQIMRGDVTQMSIVGVEPGRRRKNTGWLKRLRSAICMVNWKQEDSQFEPFDLDSSTPVGFHRVKVHDQRKRGKELSAVYKEQDIPAHKGSILTMKFSPDGQYLASAGEDEIVRIWQVKECLRMDEHLISKLDPSCVYFTVNGSSELSLSPLFPNTEKSSKQASLSKTSDSTCVILPQKCFYISENPLHEFYGHSGNILDLSWSKNEYLLSSSEDNTVRLWQVGCHRCLKVFPHCNYVTSVQFNPVNGDHFVSGSVDGKVRIWSISTCHVVDWIETRDMVSAVCYRPDGKGIVVGSFMGDCRFYVASDSGLQLDAQVSLQGKKKSPSKRITGFQFSSCDPGKVMVTSADSKIRILDGVDVICKYHGAKNSGSQRSACFTSDGKHIISIHDDSNVYIWNHTSLNCPLPQRPKSVRSFERFASSNALVAIPWLGMKPGKPANQDNVSQDSVGFLETVCQHLRASLVSSSRSTIALSHDLFSDSPPKGSATWPEEKLPTSTFLPPAATLSKTHYKTLKTSCQNALACHAWDQVIVTAGSDGRIRSFHNYGLPIRW